MQCNLVPMSVPPVPPAPTRPPRANILGVGVSITDYTGATACVLYAAQRKQPLLLAASDVNAIMQARLDRRFAAVLNNFDLVTPDGQPVRWGMRWTGQASLKDRLYGPTLMLHVCEGAARHGLSVFLYGSRAETLDRLRGALVRRLPGLDVRGVLPGRFRPLTADEQDADAATIRASGADILFVGMGCPRQEWWMFHMRNRLSMPMLAVGAAFDIHAGMIKQAPPLLQKHGLEWLYRLSREPRRLARRYLLVTPQYLPLIASQALGLQKYPVVCDLGDAANAPCPG
ncbi:MAG TPA: WecB/TagA/CpsF family glycosyltransferase [Polyangiales bacterium]